jgi:hypothetical protein
MILAKASLNYDHSFIVLATVIRIVNYDHKTVIVLATVIRIVNYDRKTFIVQSTGERKK